jgi:hypothetical protein
MRRVSMSIFSSVLWLGLFVSWSGAQTASEPAAPALRAEWPYEVLSGGTRETTFLIARDVFEKGKLAEPVKVDDDLVVTHAFVGWWQEEPKTKRFFLQTGSAVPLTAGQIFGWVLKVQTTRREVTLEEVFRLPERGQSWSVDQDRTTISDDGLSATTASQLPVWDFLYNLWTMEAGDPAGKHEFSLSIDDVKIADLPLEVKKPSRP